MATFQKSLNQALFVKHSADQILKFCFDLKINLRWKPFLYKTMFHYHYVNKTIEIYTTLGGDQFFPCVGCGSLSQC